MAIEGLRQMERHGGAIMLERAFDGFLALSAPEDCWAILGTPKSPSESGIGRDILRERIMFAFREAAKKLHGAGGDMDRLVKARDEALRQIA
jgi:hypothetical protein